VIGKLKDDPETRDIKVVFLSNLGRPEPEHQALNDRAAKEAGALGYIKKTDDLEVLAEKVKNFISQ
jgi:CheY-like chemotaxis protein